MARFASLLGKRVSVHSSINAENAGPELGLGRWENVGSQSTSLARPPIGPLDVLQWACSRALGPRAGCAAQVPVSAVCPLNVPEARR